MGGSMITANAAGYVGLSGPSGAAPATGLLITSTAFGLAGSALGFAPSGPSQSISKMKQLQDSINNNMGKLVDDINQQGKVLKGCIESVKAWAQGELIKLQKAEVFNYLSPLVLDAHNAVGTAMTYRYVGQLANRYSQEMHQCKRVSNTLSIIGMNKHKIEEAFSLLGLVDEYMNICNRFAAGYQMTHNMADDTNVHLHISRLHGFDITNQMFTHFAGYLSTLESRSFLVLGWNAKRIVQKYKYKALSIQRQWAWVKLHHQAGKTYPARQSPRGNQCWLTESSRPSCRICVGSYSSLECYERVNGAKGDDGRSFSYDTKGALTSGYEKCYSEGGSFFPEGTTPCHHKGLESYDGATGQWIVPYDARRGTSMDPSQQGCNPPWHAACR